MGSNNLIIQKYCKPETLLKKSKRCLLRMKIRKIVFLGILLSILPLAAFADQFIDMSINLEVKQSGESDQIEFNIVGQPIEAGYVHRVRLFNGMEEVVTLEGPPFSGTFTIPLGSYMQHLVAKAECDEGIVLTSDIVYFPSGPDGSFFTHHWLDKTLSLTFNSKIEIVQPGDNINIGAGHAAVIARDGTLWTWGDNINGALGIGTIGGTYDEPVRVSTETNWKSVNTGIFHTLAIKKDGSLWNSGVYNVPYFAEFLSSYGTPSITRVGNDNDWIRAFTLFEEVLGEGCIGLKKDGTLWGWGASLHINQILGRSIFATETIYEPVPLNLGAGWKYVTFGGIGDLIPNYVPIFIRELSTFFILQSGRRSGAWRIAARREGSRGHIIQAAVRTMIIIFQSPILHNNLCLLRRMKYFTIQNIITQLAVERLNVTVLPRTAGCNVQCLNVISFKPFLNRIRNKLRPIITANELRYSTNHEQILHYRNNIHGTNRSAQFNGRTFTGKLVQHRKDLKLAAVIMDGTISKEEREFFKSISGPTWVALRSRSQASERSLKELFALNERVQFLQDKLQKQGLATLKYVPTNSEESI